MANLPTFVKTGTMQVFFAPDINGGIHVLDENESKHIIRVLRMKTGMPVRLIDGKGNLYEGEIHEDNFKKCSIRIKGIIRDFEKRNYNLHIAISPIKNSERFEWFIEKSVEIGIDTITPIICHNTVKQVLKTARINSIIVSAMKQSLKATRTVLNEPLLFRDLISAGYSGKKMIAHCNPFFERHKISDLYTKNENAIILIGPEGDFTNDEIIVAAEKGFTGISLGISRLRTETAGIAACHSVYFINQQ